jgi:hypothetical protein
MANNSNLSLVEGSRLEAKLAAALELKTELILAKTAAKLEAHRALSNQLSDAMDSEK